MPKLTNELYNALKWLALIGLPAVASLYFAMAGIWGWPDADKVVGSITALDTFLGLLVHVSSRQFSKNNNLVVIPTPNVRLTPPSE